MKKLKEITVLMSFLLIMTACGSNQEDKKPTGESNGGGDKKVEIMAAGSTAMQPLVENIAEIYMTDHPNYSIQVQGGGSGTGLSQVAAGTVQIGNSDVFAEEKDGIDASKLEDHLVAVAGIAPVVNKDVGVNELSKDQLVDIFTGKIKNWQEVGGKDAAIAVINRAEGSGTRATFEQFALDGKKSVQSQEQDSSGTVKKMVAETPGAISYLAFSYIDDSLKALAIDKVEPTAENVADNSWKIWSYEHMYTQKEVDKDVVAFIDFVKSEDVQKNVVEHLQYIPMTAMKVTRNSDGEIEK